MMIRTTFVWLCLSIATVAIAGCDDAATATSPTTTSPVTDTWPGQIPVGGSATRSFSSASSGTATITLTQVGPPADVVVGLGVGIPHADGTACYLTQSMETGASSAPQITVSVEAGAYCVRVYDIGRLTSQVAFGVTIVRP